MKGYLLAALYTAVVIGAWWAAAKGSRPKIGPTPPETEETDPC